MKKIMLYSVILCLFTFLCVSLNKLKIKGANQEIDYVTLVDNIINDTSFDFYMSFSEVNKGYYLFYDKSEDIKDLIRISGIGNIILEEYINMNLNENSTTYELKKLHFFELFLCSKEIYVLLNDDEISSLNDMLEINRVLKKSIENYPYLTFAYKEMLRFNFDIQTLSVVYSETVKTIKGNEIEISFTEESDMSIEEKNEKDMLAKRKYPDILKIKEPTYGYSCDGYAYYSQGDYVFSPIRPNVIFERSIEDGSLLEYNENDVLKKGDKLHYVNKTCEDHTFDHIAIIEYNPYNYTLSDLSDITKAKNVFVKSKWGLDGGVYYHSVCDYDYYYEENIVFECYTPNYDSEINNLNYTDNNNMLYMSKKTYKINNNNINTVNFNFQLNSISNNYSIRLYNYTGTFIEEFTEADYNVTDPEYAIDFKYVLDDSNYYLSVEAKKVDDYSKVTINENNENLLIDTNYLELDTEVNFKNNLIVDEPGNYVILIENDAAIDKIQIFDEGNNLIKQNIILDNTNYLITELSQGNYFLIAYTSNLFDNDIYELKIRKIEANEMYNTLIVDPANNWNCGSQINILENSLTESNKSYKSNVVIEGFTRICYFDNNITNISSRLNYKWISSNEDVLKVTEYGTIIGKDVSKRESVVVYVISKLDPTLIYIKEFFVEPYIGDELQININLTYTVGDEATLEIGNYLPYNYMQAYVWSSTNDSYLEINSLGVIKAKTSGRVEINGYYLYNNKIKVVIVVNIFESI